MEAVAAVALAGNVLQFVQLGLSVLSKGNSLKRSHDGALKEHHELHMVVKDLDACLSQFDLVEDPPLNALVERCTDVGAELRHALLKIQSKGGRHLWSSYRQALSIIWNKDTLLEIEQRLERLRDEVMFHFQTLVRKDVGQILNRLYATNDMLLELKATAQATQATLIQRTGTIGAKELSDDVREIRRLRTQLEDLVRASQQQPNSPGSGIKRSDRKAFLELLEFRAMEDRIDSISNAHVNTYRWLLMSSRGPDATSDELDEYQIERQRLKANITATLEQLGVNIDDAPELELLRAPDVSPSYELQDWFQNRDGIFWLWGKPGCGKSTIMKAVLRDKKMHDRLRTLLMQWAGDQELIIASFFFFRPGMTLQKSAVGLYRALMHHLLQRHPHLLDQVFTSRQREDALRRRDDGLHDDDMWSIEELRRAFRQWRRLTNSKLYLHIDGIDEVDTSYLDTTNLLTDLSNERDVKVLAAGRWAPEFRDTFTRALALHKTTELDILYYTVDNLNTAAIVDILDDPAAQFLKIVIEISVAAQGVFQWVAIVLESLLHGARRFETFQQLQDRLDEYPRDLDKLYWFLYGCIDQRYMSDVAFWLLTTFHSFSMPKSKRIPRGKAPSDGSTLGKAKSISKLSKLTVAKICRLTDFDLNDEFWLKRKCKEYAEQQDTDQTRAVKHRRQRKSRSMQDRIQSQCPHFFEIGSPQSGLRVMFAHRTILDFIQQPHVLDSLSQSLQPGKHPMIALLLGGMPEWTRGHGAGLSLIDSHESLRQLVDLSTKWSFVDNQKFWQQLKHIPPVMTKTNASATLLFPTVSGWQEQTETQYCMGLFQRNDPAAHLLATYKPGDPYTLDYIRQAVPDVAQKELLLLEQCWRWGVDGYFEAPSHRGITAAAVARMFPAGLPSRSHCLARIIESLARVISRVREIQESLVTEAPTVRQIVHICHQMTVLVTQNGACVPKVLTSENASEDARTTLDTLYEALEEMLEAKNNADLQLMRYYLPLFVKLFEQGRRNLHGKPTIT